MDSVRYAVLGSGSSANAYIFEKDNFSFIIDNGFSLKELSRRAGVAGFDLSRVKFILLTHTHSDHFNGVGTLSRKYKIPVVVHHLLSDDDFNKMKPFDRLDVIPGKEYSFDALSFTPFSTSHDACCPLGYYFSLGEKTFMLLTDTGMISDEMRSLAEKTEIMFLEANYSADLLRTGSYPAFLKNRISSEKGHLSNDDAIEFLNSMKDSTPDMVYLCHLSDSNNSPERIMEDLGIKLKWNGNIQICNRGEIYESP
ncbi:MAG: MBL fold metallo-hydrolase [Spirochaetales bacterium]|nr:MBL fold metallo-hydrolase [Spirochaetales bacterium]